MAFEFSTKWFKPLIKEWKNSFFKKDTPVLLGRKLPLTESKMGKDLNKVKNWEEVSSCIYAKEKKN